jgi:AraC family transcriptional regulator, transcriptional activator FtrA
MPRRDKRAVAALAYDGLGAFEFGIVAEVFGLPRPEMGPNWYRFQACSLNRGRLRATGGVTIQAPGRLADLARAGTIVIPGWKSSVEPPRELISALRRAHSAGARLVSICSGVFVLAATGLLNGKRATTHWRYAELLRQRHPEIRVEPDVLYVDEGSILTSAGSAAGIDLCLHIVRLDYGAEVANEVARRLVMPPHREGGQAQYVRDAARSAPADALAPVLEWAAAHLHQDLSVEHLAKRAAMSPRTFARRFQQQTGTTPHQWLMHQRLLAAQRRLEKTAENIDQIAEVVGLGNATTLRQYFSRVLKTTPSAYRRQFSTRLVKGSGKRLA